MKIQFRRAQIDTPVGAMVALADERALYLLEFADRSWVEDEIERLCHKTNGSIVAGGAKPLASIEKELGQYFQGALTTFRTPLVYLGTPFQQAVWEELQKIPFGQTRSYAEVAHRLQKPTAYRAVAQANGSNQLAIVIPCHRVINTGGKLGGYGGGLDKKQWLLDHEQKIGKGI